MLPPKPSIRPSRPFFSSGPCAKPPGWDVTRLKNVTAGRSHRSAGARAKLKQIIDDHKRLLGIPENYRVGIVPGSSTGAIEAALWSLLGARGVDVIAHEVFSYEWLKDIRDQLKLVDARYFEAPFGALPDLTQIDKDRDIVVTWNGTTSGTCVPDGEWIADDRAGLVICDATSAVFAFDLPWDKLDVTIWSWQKGIGSEAAHGMIALSPRALHRLETYTPSWPIPKLFRLAENQKVIEGIFTGETINTPSMLAAEDCLMALAWAEKMGGVPALRARAFANGAALDDWVQKTPWIDYLATDPRTRSITSVFLKIVDPWLRAQSAEHQAQIARDLAALLESEGAAYDVLPYRGAPPGLRIWCGGTVETADIKALTPWIDWGYAMIKQKADG